MRPRFFALTLFKNEGVLIMTWDYAEKKIREAMHLHRGNSTRVRQQVIAWAMDDPKLLRTLVKPHMVGITAHAVSRVESGKTRPVPLAQDAPTSRPELRATRSNQGYNSTGRSDQNSAKSQETKSAKKDSFGMDILKTIAGGKTPEFGQENYNTPRSKQGVSQSHIDAIHAMIKKSSEN